ncbi:MAG TPA: TIGR03086 family metal-binding protein [Acidothermaceae bacterium]
MTVTSHDIYRRASGGFDATVHQIGEAHWDSPTPCEKWSVHDLVNHVVGEDRWIPPLLAGLTIAEVGNSLDGDLLGDDPTQAWSTAWAAALAAADATEPDRIVQLSFGPTATAEYLWQIAADHLIHGWDLAVAIGADHHLDEPSVTAVHDWFVDREEMYRAGGAIAARPPVAADASPQTRLLAMFGRDNTSKRAT